MWGKLGIYLQKKFANIFYFRNFNSFIDLFIKLSSFVERLSSCLTISAFSCFSVLIVCSKSKISFISTFKAK